MNNKSYNEINSNDTIIEIDSNKSINCKSNQCNFDKCNFDKCNITNCNCIYIIKKIIKYTLLLFIIIIIAYFIYNLIHLEKDEISKEVYNNTIKEEYKHINYNYIYSHKILNDKINNIYQLYSRHNPYYRYHRHHRKCEDFKYGCCNIYLNSDKYYHLSLYKIIPHNKNKSNCPNLSDLVYNYNIWRKNYFDDKEVDCNKYKCCKINVMNDLIYNNVNVTNNYDDYYVNINFNNNSLEYNYNTQNYKLCPGINEIVYRYNNGYDDPNISISDILVIIFTCLVIIGLLNL